MFPRLKGCSLKKAEKLFLYDFARDELYEVDEEAFEFLRYCTGGNPLSEIPSSARSREILEYCISEGLIEDRHDPRAKKIFKPKDNPMPSLRYLQLHITDNCNLNCKHCYLGRKSGTDMEFAMARKVIREFGKVGWKLLVTGGEPLLHQKFWDILSYASHFPIRIEILSNGTLINEETARRISRYAHSIQISLDGMREGHDALRGEGSFEKAIQGIKAAKEYVSVSVATIIHSKNLDQFEELEALVKELDVKEWILDVPSMKGNLAMHPDFLPPIKEASRIYEKYGFGGGGHEGDEDFSCGSHLCSVDVYGNVTKCGFFTEGVGNIKTESLLDCWRRIISEYIPRLEALECRDCEFVRECRGGCRYRAMQIKDFKGKDPFMCSLFLE
jgi:radical SAM protein with 4Fe4S-binding SPASM domain